MDITIQSSFLPHNDPDASLAFFRDTLGFEVRNDVGYEGMRWITVGPAAQPDTSIVLHPPAANPGITDDERRAILELMAKGSYFGVNLATTDLDGTFAQLESSGAEVVQEPTEQPYGHRSHGHADGQPDWQEPGCHPNHWLGIYPRRIQAWREENELSDRELMRDGRWLV